MESELIFRGRKSTEEVMEGEARYLWSAVKTAKPFAVN